MADGRAGRAEAALTGAWPVTRRRDGWERTLTPVGGSTAKKRLKSRLTSEDRAPRGFCAEARRAGDVPYGRGSRYR